MASSYTLVWMVKEPSAASISLPGRLAYGSLSARKLRSFLPIIFQSCLDSRDQSRFQEEISIAAQVIREWQFMMMASVDQKLRATAVLKSSFRRLRPGSTRRVAFISIN